MTTTFMPPILSGRTINALKNIGQSGGEDAPCFDKLFLGVLDGDVVCLAAANPTSAALVTTLPGDLRDSALYQINFSDLPVLNGNIRIEYIGGKRFIFGEHTVGADSASMRIDWMLNVGNGQKEKAKITDLEVIETAVSFEIAAFTSEGVFEIKSKDADGSIIDNKAYSLIKDQVIAVLNMPLLRRAASELLPFVYAVDIYDKKMPVCMHAISDFKPCKILAAPFLIFE